MRPSCVKRKNSVAVPPVLLRKVRSVSSTVSMIPRDGVVLVENISIEPVMIFWSWGNSKPPLMKSFEFPPGSVEVPMSTRSSLMVKRLDTPVPFVMASSTWDWFKPAESYVWNSCSGAILLILSGPPAPVVSLPLKITSSDLPSILYCLSRINVFENWSVSTPPNVSWCPKTTFPSTSSLPRGTSVPIPMLRVLPSMYRPTFRESETSSSFLVILKSRTPVTPTDHPRGLLSWSDWMKDVKELPVIRSVCAAIIASPYPVPCWLWTSIPFFLAFPMPVPITSRCASGVVEPIPTRPSLRRVRMSFSSV